jgi:hypothetical protein
MNTTDGSHGAFVALQASYARALAATAKARDVD